MVIYAISDLEGFHPSELIPNYNQIIKTNDTEVIICGDVFDSTMLSKKDHLNNKSNNLRTIHEIVTQPNLKLTFGNRDLNKMKVGPLTILKTLDNSSNELVNNFNNGLLDLNSETYNSLNANLKNLDWVHKMSNWYPFWGGINADNIGYWKNDNEPSQYGFFEKRFQKIFGPDTSVGTMSAGNLLETIPKELGLNYEVKVNNEVKVQVNNDFNAFIVLAVFKSMLLKVTQNYNDLSTFFSGTNIKLNQSMFRGLLYKMFLDPKNNMIIKKCYCEKNRNICKCPAGICNCPNDKDNMYLFSHGGVSKNIISDNTLEQLSNVLNNDNSKNLRSKLTNVKKLFTQTQTGGYYLKSQPIYTSKDIEDKILSFNQIIKQTIEAIFNEDYTKQLEPSNKMLLLLIASASFDCNSYIKKINGDQSICSKLDILNTSSDLTSTMAGIKRLRQQKSMFYKQGNLYNIFGHNPNGFLSTIDLFENNESKTYLINLDTSNTFLSTKANQKTNETNSYLTINGNTISISANIKIKSEDNEILPVNVNPIKSLKESGDVANTKIIAFTNSADQNLFMQSNVTNISINQVINDEIDKHLKQIKENENIFYHGILVKNSQKYILLTYHRSFGPPFPKCLVILKESEFNTIFPNLQLGGKYLNKYLKYKQKYISLKKQLEN